MLSFDTDTKEIARLLGINPDPIAPNDGDILKPFGANQLPIPGAADAIALPTLVSVACDNLVIPLDMSVDQGKTPAETDSHTAASVDSLTGIALAKSHEQLQQFANSPEFLSQMSLAFGDDFDVEAAQDLADSLTNGTFQTSPIKVVSAADINGANGAFAAETNNIYLSSELVADNADNPLPIVSVLLEEIGHYIDSQINISDAAGDEGAIFAGVVQGKVFDAAELQGLKAEDDTATVMLDGKATVIEQAANQKADFNGDGKTDFIRQEKNFWDDDTFNTAHVCLSTSNGSFSKQELTDHAGMKGDLTNLIFGDFNGDRRTDFIRQEKGVWDDDTANTAQVYLSNGNGTFSKQDLTNQADMKGDMTNLIVGDYNGDGKDDFIRQEKGAWDDDTANTAQVYLSNGNGTFSKQDLTEHTAMKGDLTNLIVGDYNGDGKDDFIRQETGVWDDDNANTAQVYLSNGNGTFSKQDLTDHVGMKGDLTNLILGDFNGDRRTDFIRQEKGVWDDDTANTAQVYLSNGNGTFSKQDLTDHVGMKGDLSNLIVGEFNGDRRTDFIRQEKGVWDDDTANNANIYLANSNGTFWKQDLTNDPNSMKADDGVNILTGSPQAYLNPTPSSSPTPTGGKYQLPYPDGTTYKVYQGNNGGYSHSDQWNRYAWDFGMPEGNTVVATRSGKVVSLYEGSQTRLTSMNGWAQYTNYVLIDHGDGTSSFYSHLKNNSVLPNVGDYVSQNQPIAQSGNTGFSTDPHLHYSVQKTPSYIPPGGFSNTSGYATESLPSSFSDPNVLSQNSNGVPTSPNYYTS